MIPGGREVLGTGRFETFLRRLLSVKGQVAPRMADHLQAGVDLLAPPWELAEAALLMGWRGYQAMRWEAGVALSYSFVQLQNPAGSGSLAVVKNIYTQSNSAASAYIVYIAPIPPALFAGTAVTSRTRLDTRGPDPIYTPGSCLVTSGANGDIPPYQARTLVQLGTGGNLTEVDFAISPGWALDIRAGAVNTEIRVGLTWYERAAEPSELAAR